MEEIEQRVMNDHYNTIEKLRKQLHTSQKDGSSMSARLDDLNKNQAAQEAAMEKMIKDYESKIYDLQTTISDNVDVIKENGNFFFVQKNKNN